MPPLNGAASPPKPASAAASTTSAGAAGSAFASLSNAPTGSLGSTLESLRTLVHKRKTAWTYLKNAADGRVYWFNTILLTDDELRIAFPNEKMRNRSTRFTVLGMSLSSLLDISPAHDFLRALLALVQEFEAIPEERFGGRHQQPKSLFKVGSRSRKGAGSHSGSSSGGGVGGGGGDLGMTLGADGGDSSMLFIPNIPFELDYFQVLITTCEILVEVYTKIGSYLGPSASASSTSSFTSAGLFPQPPTAGAASGGMGARGAGVGAGSGALGLSPALIDTVYKVDARLKKLIALLSKEIDTLARAAIKAELNSFGAGEYGLDA
ncbi:hypothetical protein JCM3774_004808 [Rhodotorula dairenensis]